MIPNILGLKADFISRLDEAYDLYAYFEDDLVILTLDFSEKLIGFVARLVMIVYCCLIELNSLQFLMLSIVSSLMAPLQSGISVV